MINCWEMFYFFIWYIPNENWYNTLIKKEDKLLMKSNKQKINRYLSKYMLPRRIWAWSTITYTELLVSGKEEVFNYVWVRHFSDATENKSERLIAISYQFVVYEELYLTSHNCGRPWLVVSRLNVGTLKRPQCSPGSWEALITTWKTFWLLETESTAVVISGMLLLCSCITFCS